MKNRNRFVQMLVICVVVMLAALGTVTAQEGDMIEPLALSSEPVVLQFSTGAAGPPTIEPLTDGRMAFRIMAAGEISGTFAGNISARVSEVTLNPSPTFHPVTVMFTIETEQGQIEGYYAGSFHRPEGAEQANIEASGVILSVSGAYADLYLADVTVSSQVQFVDGRSVGESGTITIAAR
ncbi:MAG: hypothetical protein K8L97_18020 [Anaerolineae bacterium]|nr:hypothetical protein [Anaerolineae bacterium]